jgi:hypothetical protein
MSPPLAIQPGFEKVLKKLVRFLEVIVILFTFQGYWNKFVNQFIDGFLTLHRNFGMIKNFSNVLFSGTILLFCLNLL